VRSEERCSWRVLGGVLAFAVFLAVWAYYFPMLLVAIPALAFIVLCTSLWGIKGGLISATLGAAFMTVSYLTHPEPTVRGLVLAYLGCFILGAGVGMVVSRIRESEKRYRLLYERGEELEEILKRERDIFRQYFDLVQTIIVALDREGKVTFINRKGCEVLGYPYSEIIGKNWFENFLPERMRDEVKGVFQKLISGEVEPLESYENPVLTRDGTERIILWHNTILRDDSGRITGTLSSGEDVTALRHQARRLELLYRAAETLLTEELDVEERARTAVRIPVEDLGVDLAWVGFAEPDGRVQILAWYPEDHSYTRGLNVRWDDTPLGQSPAGKAIRSGTPQIAQDLTSDPNFTPWRDRVIQFGFQSAAAFPLKARRNTVGILVLYSTRKAFFARELVYTLQAFAHLAASALESARLFEETQKNLRKIQALRSIDTAIAGSTDPRVTFSVALDELTHQLGIDAADILLFNPHALTIECVAHKGFRGHLDHRVVLWLGESLAGRVALERRMITVKDLPTFWRREVLEVSEEHARGFERLIAEEGFLTYYGVPLIAKGQFLGVLEVFQRTPAEETEEWAEFLEMLANQMAIAIDNAILLQKLERTNLELTRAYDATLEGWARVLELHDRETEGHSRRVTEMTLEIARRMGVREEDLIHIRRGALLHDIGKLGIPDSILLKPGKLTEEEWEIMKKHPVYAYEMLSKIAYLRPALDIPYCHHEKWDGSGYPRGLKGEEIPLPARIFAVVDVFDALTSDRPYRKAWSREEAIAYIKERSGKDFDPAVVEVFLEVIGASRTQEAS